VRRRQLPRQAGARHRCLRGGLPHIATVDQAYNAVCACRYPRLKSASLYEAAGIRGDGPTCAPPLLGRHAAGVLPARGRLAAQPGRRDLRDFDESRTRPGIENLPEILENVPGIGGILIGEGDLSQELGHPRQYGAPRVLAAIGQVVATCKRFQGHRRSSTRRPRTTSSVCSVEASAT